MGGKILSSVLTLVITLATSVLALLTQEGVTQLTDISQTAWLAAVVGAVLAGANTLKARITPEERKQP